MHFDDRLATVLRSRAAGESGARTQFRQLVDLLGAASPEANGPFVDSAYARLGEIADLVPATEQSRILREPGQRLRNPRLVAWIAAREPQAAAAAMATARMDEDQWLDLIPRLPVNARGFLRHRRDLPARVKDLLKRLGVEDLVLTRPEGAEVVAPAEADRPAEAPAPPSPPSENGIRNLVRRIEAFRQARENASAPADPRLPLDDAPDVADVSDGQSVSIDFGTDATGRIAWAEREVAAMLVGLSLTSRGPGAPARLHDGARTSLERRQPLVNGKATLAGPDAVAGEWRIDAAPLFDSATGTFLGHSGRLRRIPAPAPAAGGGDGSGDLMRQVLHELRTPVNAIQGYAEIIQQQLFGSAPNSYRALAAAIAVDGARLLAGFDEIDRLARLESGALDPEPGECDLRTVIVRTAKRLEGALRPRGAGIDLTVSGGPFTVALEEGDAAQLAWRLLASLAGSLAPGETVELTLHGDGATIRLDAELPQSMRGGDIFAGLPPKQASALSAGMFGSGFTLRLVRAETLAAGGSLETGDECLVLRLPALTATGTGHSDGDGPSAESSAM